MNIELKNKTALIGGSTAGLGKAIAMQLATSGASVILMARNEEKLKKLTQELPCSDGQVHRYITVDFNDFKSTQEMIDGALRTEEIDILVNNTQGPQPGGVLEKTTADYQEAFDLLFKTVCATTLALIPNMKKKGWGRIINVSSLTVAEPSPTLVLSNTIRTALISWSKSLSQELAPFNITVNNILTGFFDTDRMNNLIKDQAHQSGADFNILKKKKESTVPMKRFGRPEEYGFLASFLASDQAAYITGTNIPIDGGLLRSL